MVKGNIEAKMKIERNAYWALKRTKKKRAIKSTKKKTSKRENETPKEKTNLAPEEKKVQARSVGKKI